MPKPKKGCNMKGKATCLATCDVCGEIMNGHARHLKHVANICSLKCFERLCKNSTPNRPKKATATAVHDRLEKLAERDTELDFKAPGSIQKFQYPMLSFRSEGEKQLKKLLDILNVGWSYEPYVFYLEIRGSWEGYVPDFETAGTFIEVKGYWTLEGRRKVEAMKVFFPWVPIIVLDEETIADLWRECRARVRSNSR